MKTHSSFRHSKAFSLVEVITVVAVLGILAAMAYQFASGIGDRIRQTKLESDVHTLNSAVKVYLASGGSLAGVTDATAVIRKLKSMRNEASAAKYAGFRGSMLDARVTPVFQTEAEAFSGKTRAIWNPGRSAFVVSESGVGGISHFALNETVGAEEVQEEERAPGAVDYNVDNGWIWAYRDSSGTGRAAPTVVTVATPTPGTLPSPAPALRLVSPQFSTSPGTYDYPNFPVTVTISNPNPQGSSTIYYATAWDGSGIQWFPYTGPVPVLPGMQILTCARHISSQYEDSYTVGGVYVRNTYPLQAPQIVASATCLNLQTNDSVTIQLVDPNPAFATHRLEYSVNGGSFTTYSGSISISPTSYATGLTLTARCTPAADGILASPEASNVLNVKLRTPGIEIGQATGTGSGSTIPVTLSNSNPQGSSLILYALRDEATGTTSSYQEYRNPLAVSQEIYPKGFTVLAYANPTAGNYLSSDEASSLGLTFFGIPVNGNTIFVLDHSGSMAWEDGIGQVKTEMNRVLDLLKPEDKFGIVQFSTDAGVVVRWSAASAKNVKNAKTKVNGLTANGWTNYEQALKLALEAAQNNEVKQVVFLSDGAPTIGDTNPDHILSLVRQIVAKGAQVDTLAFGLITPDGRQLLDQMAAVGAVHK